MTKKQLWERLRSYQFEDLVPANLWDIVQSRFGGTDASAKAFATKLASKNGWTLEFALRALEEYKKYVFLGVTAKSPVTPSRIIDVVWHEHGLFMDGYRHFRRKVIENDFQHCPELITVEGGDEIYREQYLRTVALYLREFGHLPPADIWARPKYAPRPGGIRATQTKSAQKPSRPERNNNEYDLEELEDLLNEIVESLELNDEPLRQIFAEETVEQSDTNPEFSAAPSVPSTPVEVEAYTPTSHGGHSSSVESTSHHSDSGSDGGGSSCSSSSCGGSCGS